MGLAKQLLSRVYVELLATVKDSMAIMSKKEKDAAIQGVMASHELTHDVYKSTFKHFQVEFQGVK